MAFIITRSVATSNTYVVRKPVSTAVTMDKESGWCKE